MGTTTATPSDERGNLAHDRVGTHTQRDQVVADEREERLLVPRHLRDEHRHARLPGS